MEGGYISGFKEFVEQFQLAGQLPWEAKKAVTAAALLGNLNSQQKIATFDSIINNLRPNSYELQQFMIQLSKLRATINPNAEQ